MLCCRLDHDGKSGCQCEVRVGRFEGKEYARYVWANPNGLQYQDVKPMQCKVIDKDGQVQRCQSSGEFDALVNAYMTE